MENNIQTQVIERLKEAQNILVTVSEDPSIDQLSAALAFTLLMNKLDKRATAVFSGKIPSTLNFLAPENLIESTTDSLRDFIVSLDKAKADRLKYKVEDDMVKIFITPYKTSLTSDDLVFSQGDFNVDVVFALGVTDREHIDKAIVSHGRILHDATVIGVMAGEKAVDVAGINWQDAEASSLCEMLFDISDKFGAGLMDNQIATAYLTGIVAETDRFSNEKTNSKVMTMSAQLMAQGANQQLISNELNSVEEEAAEVVEPPSPPITEDTIDADGVLTLSHPIPPKHPDFDEHEIDIDGVGNFKSAEELNNELANEDQAQEDAGLELPSPIDLESIDNSVVEEVKNDAGLATDVAEPVVDEHPMNSSQHDDTVGDNVNPLNEQQLANQSTETNFEQKLATIPAAPKPDENQVVDPDQKLQHFADPKPSIFNRPLGPDINATETIDKIENDVMSFESSVTEPALVDNRDSDAARQAVQQAIDASGDFDPNRPEPIKSINAVEMTPGNVSLPVAENQAPPVSPPPFIPPFPASNDTSS